MDFPNSVPSIGLVNGKFADEDPLAGTPGSLIPSAWGNAVTDELLAVITAAGLVPDEATFNQLNLAINAKISNAAVEFASQAEAEAGTAVNKIMTPNRVFQAIAKVVGQATETVFGWAKVATQAETNAGASDTTIVTPKKLYAWFTTFSQATESSAGLAAVATQAQVTAGADDAKMVTPLKLAQRLSSFIGQATEAVLGWAKIATTAQVSAGADDTTIVTPYKLSRGGNILGIANNGHIKFPNWLGRFSIQWSTYTVSTTDTAFSFPTTFESVVGAWVGFYPTSSTALGTVEVVYIKSVSNSTITLQCSAGSRTCKVLAIGIIP